MWEVFDYEKDSYTFELQIDCKKIKNYSYGIKQELLYLNRAA